MHFLTYIHSTLRCSAFYTTQCTNYNYNSNVRPNRIITKGLHWSKKVQNICFNQLFRKGLTSLLEFAMKSSIYIRVLKIQNPNFSILAKCLVASLQFYSNSRHWISVYNLIDLGCPCPIDQAQAASGSRTICDCTRPAPRHF